jgi:predicted RNA binding protein YcfA (HicA-like mRNA interferase family)
MAESKLVQRLYEQVVRTRKNCAFEDIERLLLAAGFTERRGKGSHRIFKLGTITISIPERPGERKLRRTFSGAIARNRNLKWSKKPRKD